MFFYLNSYYRCMSIISLKGSHYIFDQILVSFIPLKLIFKFSEEMAEGKKHF